MTELIEYSLELPANKIGEKLAKTVGRILKHTYSARRLRIQHSKDLLIISARVDRFHLEAIRGAVNMTMMARGIQGKLNRDAKSQQSATEGNEHRGARSEGAVQEESRAASHDPPAVA